MLNISTGALYCIHADTETIAVHFLAKHVVLVDRSHWPIHSSLFHVFSSRRSRCATFLRARAFCTSWSFSRSYTFKQRAMGTTFCSGAVNSCRVRREYIFRESNQKPCPKSRDIPRYFSPDDTPFRPMGIRVLAIIQILSSPRFLHVVFPDLKCSTSDVEHFPMLNISETCNIGCCTFFCFVVRFCQARIKKTSRWGGVQERRVGEFGYAPGSNPGRYGPAKRRRRPSAVSAE